MPISPKLFLLFAITIQVLSQNCIDNDGNSVSWWVMINTPKTTPTVEYLYFDSSFVDSSFSLFSTQPSDSSTALSRTLSQINTLSLHNVAWNDDKPNGPTSSSAAHSKTVIAHDPSKNKGFILDHSLPQYPSFNSNTINITIPDNQSIYAQHLFCISLPGDTLEKIAMNLRIIKPYIYQSNVPAFSSYPNIYALGTSVSTLSTSNFQYFDFVSNGIQFKTIYKNGNSSKNCSIFEDGLNNYLQDSLFAETWGRPLDAAWCGSPKVNNVNTVQVNSSVKWTETQDHSKWVITQNKNWSCFGDMNRMKSQWKRGGAFYCLESPVLRNALAKLIVTDSC